MSDSTHLKSRNLLADAFVAAGLDSAAVNAVRLPGRSLLPNVKAALDVIEALLVERDKYRAHSELLNRCMWRIAGRLGRITPGSEGAVVNPEELFDTFMQLHLESGDAVATSNYARDRAYGERNALVVAFAKAALSAGWKAGRGIDNDPEKDWDPEWRHVVYVELPSGQQVSWHIAPAQLGLLEGLPQHHGEWDGTFLARDLRWCQFDANVSPLLERLYTAETSLTLRKSGTEEVHRMYEQLRAVIDGGSESMTHADAVELAQKWAKASEEPVINPGDVEFTEYPRVPAGDGRMRVGGLPRGVEATSLKHGVVIICDSERSQHLNRERALAGLRAMIKHVEPK